MHKTSHNSSSTYTTCRDTAPPSTLISMRPITLAVVNFQGPTVFAFDKKRQITARPVCTFLSLPELRKIQY